MRYFLGADLGSTKTHVLIVDDTGRALGFGESGTANHETVGYEGMYQSMQTGLRWALLRAGLKKENIVGAGFGISGFDWPSEKQDTAQAIKRLGLNVPFIFVNDAVAGLVAGAEKGWGVAVVSGTGCNCRGWDRQHKREGRVTGHGILMGEGAGGTELVYRAMQLVGYSWSKRLPKTALSDAFIACTGAKNLDDLIERYSAGYYQIGAEAAPIVFQVAKQGDAVARRLIQWAGCELGEMTNAVIRQLEFENLAFDVVLTGSMFDGGEMLIKPMQKTINRVAPHARLLRLNVPPVLGAAILGMEAGGIRVTSAIRKTMKETVMAIR